MSSRHEIIFAGAGGQGLVQAGALLGESAVKHAGLRATCTQAYGIASRGGLARSEVVISDEAVTYPFCIEPVIVVALTEPAWRQLVPRLCPDTTVIVDDSFADRLDGPCLAFPLLETACASGRIQDANMVALGLVVRALGLFGLDAVEQTITDRYGPDNHRLAAVGFGFDLGKDRLWG